MKPLTLHITGMSCGHCLNTVSSSLSPIAGVTVRTLRIGRAELEYDPDKISPEAIARAVTDTGYPAVPTEP